MKTVRVNRKAAARVASGHPWIFRSDVVDVGDAEPGDVVRVAGPAHALGMAHFSSASQITLRMLSTKAEEPGPRFYRDRVAQAARYRERVVRDTDAYRLVYAEADALPALIVDRYADYFVVQALDQGMDRALPEVTAALVDLFQPTGIFARNDSAVRAQEALPRESTVLFGELPNAIPVRLGDLTLEADPRGGMKTGIFLDQRENYAASARYASGVALDCFTSTGGFALHLARVCDRVEAVDSSGPALANALRNAERNRIENITWREADVFEALQGYSASRRTFKTIVLDPPAFAKSRSHVEQAARAYREINRRALGLLEHGGVLVTCSCSHHVSEADLLGVIAEAALDAKCNLRVIERRTQAQDHPILLSVPETLYLKCLIFEVLRQA